MPGVPLTLGNVPEVLQCLQAALQAGDMQKQAETHLQGMEDRQGFCSCLAEIILDKNADHSARWLASVQLKNMVSKYWRSRPDPKSISKEEKAHVRSKLPQLVVQDDSQIAVQIALTWAKIARQDYPQDCPLLFTDLLSMLSAPGATPLVVRRALLVVHHTTKELATKRLAADQRNFAQVASQLSGPVWSQWCADTASLISGLPTALAPDLGTAAISGQVQQLLLTLERWLLLLKVLRRLLVFGHVSDHKSLQPVQEVCVCAPAMLQALQQLISIRPGPANRPVSSPGLAPGDSSSNGGHRPAANPQRHQLGVMLDRGLLKLTKVMGAIQEAHPWSFHASGVLLHTLSFCCEQLMTNQAHGGGVTAASTSWDRFLIQCMTFIMNALTCHAYKGKTSSGSELTDHEQDLPHRGLVSEVSSALSSWWTQERLTGLTNALVTGYMRLTVRDLEEWSASSEEFYHAGDVSGWQEHVGLAAEALYLILIKDHRAYLGPQIIQLLQDASAACPLTVLAAEPVNLPGASVVVGHGPSAVRYPSALLAYDAVLSAVSKGAYELHDYLDFSSWLRAHIMPILSTTGPMLRVLRRQALRVVASWVARLEDVDRHAMYLAVLTCMAENDETMQLTSVSCLHALVDDWNFSEEGFEACVGTSMQLLLRVLSGCSQLDSQTQAFNLMNLIIERMGDLIKPWVEPLSGLLPGLWAAAEGQSLLRIQVLLALQRLVNVLGMTSPALYPLLLPLLTYATDPNQPEALHLLEDGLGLWLVALRNAPSPQPPLLALLPHIPAILNTSTEHIAMCMALVTSAAIMARDALVTHVHDVCAAFTCMMGSVNEKGMLVLLPALEMVLAASPQCVEGLRPATSKLLASLLAGQETPLVQAVGCCVFSRLLLVAPGELALLLSNLSGAPAAAGHLSRLLEIWTEGFDALGQPRQRKLSALGLCGVIAHVPSPPVIQTLDVILACVTGVWAELEGGGPSALQEEDASAWAMLAAVDSGFEAALSVAVASEDAEGECTRRSAMRANDPVARASLRDALRSALETARASLGQTLNAALAALDPSLGAQLQGMMSSTAVPPPL